MTYQTVLPWSSINRKLIERFLAISLIVLLVSQTLLEIFPAVMFQAATLTERTTEASVAPSPYGLKPATQPLPPLWVPDELAGKPEVAMWRTANSATYDVGNNTYATVQEVNPIHYQDQSGTWQRIDPAFVETPLGWLNGTNTVRTLVGKYASNATIAAADVSVNWDPKGLVIVDNGGDRNVIAEPLPVALAKPVAVNATVNTTGDAKGATARYSENWSLDGLQDQWQTAAGRSEYTMRLSNLPATEWWRGAPQALDMRVRLQLNPGTTLEVDGEPVTLPFATQRPITFVGAKGEAMVLQPPFTYEQNNQEVNVTAEYLLSATEDADVIELRVRTPWVWLAAPERQFPVILDPVFQMTTGTQVSYASYLTKDGTFNNNADFSWTRIGRRISLFYRAILIFDLPVTPIGTTIAKAYMHLVPQDINRPKEAELDFQRDYLRMNVFAHALNVDWQMNGEPQFNQTPIGGGPQPMEFSRGTTVQKGSTWDVTTLAQSWARHPDVFTQNPGVILRAENELCSPDKKVGPATLPNTECGAFYFEENSSSWSNNDLVLTNALTRPDSLYTDQNSEKGGIRLVVYFNGPTLNHNSVSPATGDLAMPTGGEPYYRADHVYTIPPLPDNQWQAFVGRGRGAPIGTNPPPQIGDLFQIPTSGATPLALRRSAPGQAPIKEISLRSVKPADDTVSYILYNGRGAPASNFDSNTLLYVESSHAVSDTASYDVRSVQELGTITSVLGEVEEVFYEFSSAQPMALWNLALPTSANVPGTSSLVKVEVFNDLTASHTALNIYGSKFNAAVVHSTNQADLPTSPQLNPSEKWQYDIAEFSKEQATGGGPLNLPVGPVKLTSRIFTPGSGQHALVLTYAGPELIVNDNCDPNVCGPELAAAGSESNSTNAPDAGSSNAGSPNAMADVINIKYQVKVQVLTCPAGYLPIPSGACQQVKCPTAANVPDQSLYRSAGNLSILSFSGWGLNGADNITPPITATPPVAPIIGKSDKSAFTVAVLDGRVRYNTTPNPDSVLLEGSTNTTIMLIECQQNQEMYTKFFQVYRGELTLNQILAGLSTIPSFEPTPTKPGLVFFNAWQAQDISTGDVQNESISIRPSVGTGLAIGAAQLRRRTGVEDQVLTNLRFDVTWSVTVNGYPSLTSSVAIRDDSETPNRIATVAFDPGNGFEMDIAPAVAGDLPTTPRRFEAIRVLLGSVTQNASLGGASKDVRALILPPFFPMAGDATIYCPRSCIDLRAPDDTRAQPKRKWAMPDIHTNTNVGMMAMSTPGSMTVFSKDAPNASPDAMNFSQEFSFDAFNATVSVEEDTCLTTPSGTPTGPRVLVIKGETRIAMPNIGSPNDPTAGISASFKLCDLPPDDLGLRSVHLSFDSPVGIPIGTSGLFLTGLSGGVSIYPTYTEIEFGLDFQTEPSGPGGVLKGSGTVLISTLGLFEYQGNARLLGLVNVSGHLWVAWNPIDIGFDVSLSIGNWLEGNAFAHMWKGRGFYNYTWLPDDDDMHFTAGVSAFITIEEGAVVDTELLVLPWEDIVFGIELEFGEFCTNNSCTTYEFGVKGAFVIGDYHVGLYYGFDEGLDLILGNDDHILIDQYGSNALRASAVNLAMSAQAGGMTINAIPDRSTFAAAPMQVGDTSTIPFNVSTLSEEILVGLSWQAGAPTLTLVKPNGEEINAGNAAANQAQILNGPNAAYITVKAPTSGAWQAKLSNLSAEGIEHYKFIFLSNKGAPGTAGNPGNFIAPGNDPVQPVNGVTRIKWQVPNDTPATAKVSLYFQRTEVITGNLLINVPIVKNLPYNTGEYNWDTRGMLNGNYKVRAVIDDGVNDLPVGQISQPEDVCVAMPSGLPPARAFDPNRFPGTAEFTSVGAVQIADNSAPDVPSGLAGSASDSALRVTWNAPAALDVAGYLIRWGERRPDALPQGFMTDNQALILASEELTYRIGAVTNDIQYGVDIAAIDVNGNTSAFAPALFLTPNAASNPVPGVPTNLALTNRTSNSASFQWQTGAGPAAANYELKYVRAGDVSEIGSLMVNTLNGTLSNLPTGAAYDVTVRALNGAGWGSAYISDTVRVIISNGVDGNGDGIADDWAAAFGLTSASGDLDGDGINNVGEYNAGTNPAKQDSDGDGFSDKEESTAGTDALNALSYGATVSQPRLLLEKNRLRFYAKNQQGGGAAPQQIGWTNAGGGNLVLQATTAESWIQTSIVGDKVQVAVNNNGLEPGFYSGIVRLLPGQGSDRIIGDPACIRVNTWVAYGDNEIPSAKQAQTINFPALANRAIDRSPFAVTASASSGLPVTIVSSTPAACTVENNMVTLLAEAACTLIASQPGNEQFSAAPDLFRTFSVLPEGARYVTYLSRVLNEK